MHELQRDESPNRPARVPYPSPTLDLRVSPSPLAFDIVERWIILIRAIFWLGHL